MILFFQLLIAHAVCDYPLQGDFIAKFKNPTVSSPVKETIWWHLMSAHCAINAGAVWWLTGNPWLGLAEFLAHFATDLAKCCNIIGYHGDQLNHVLCKFWWAYLTFMISK